jgi:hypothetical protein
MPWTYDVETQAFKTIATLLERIGALTKQEHTDVIMPFLNLHDIFPHDQPRDMRDYTHFCQLVETTTLLYYFQRAYLKIAGKKFLIATIQDLKESLELYRSVFETTRTGTEAKTLDFYHNVLEKPENGIVKEAWYLREATQAHNKSATKKLIEESVRVMMERLDQIGYIDTQKDDKDKRLNLYVLLHKKEDEKAKNVLEQDFTLVLKPQLEKGFAEWLERCPKDMAFYYMKNFDAEHWGEAEITPDELKSSIVNGESFGIFVKPESKLKNETNPKANQTDETRRFLDKGPQQTLASSEHGERSEGSERSTEALSEAMVEENLIASHCKKWHTGACPHPNPNCIVPINPCPKTCCDFAPLEQEPKKDDGLAKGAVAVLNGTSGRREP